MLQQEKIKSRNVKKRSLPTWFRAKLYEVRTGSTAGVSSYEDPGWHLGIHWSQELAYEDEDQIDAVECELDGIVRAGDIEGTIAWLWRWYPDFIRAVPARRRKMFASGLLERIQRRGK